MGQTRVANWLLIPVRGLFRVGMAIIGSAAMVNLRRIHRFRLDQRQKIAQADRNQQPNADDLSLRQFFDRHITLFLTHYYSVVPFNLLYC